MTLVACSNKSPYKTGLDSPDPDARIKAIRAIDAKDTQNKDQNIRALIQQLDHDDATIRLYAINKLEKITGKRYGYEPYHAPAKRKKAIKSWLQAYPPAPPQSRVVNPEADA